MPKPEGKPFVIPKLMVWEAWRQVKANKGAPGVDGQALDEFEADLKNQLYRIWNRMSSGSYFPPPVRAVEVPKPHGDGVRLLGVPTISDRVAQTVVAMYLGERAEPRFHPDSYGYRPGKSAHDAIGVCQQRCWKFDWMIDLDVQKFFDSVPWDLVVKAVEAVTDCRWVLLYVKRWLAAAMQYPDGTLVQRDKGTPQGGGFADPGESVHAFRVRFLDGPELSGLSVRALCRRWGRALREQAAGRACACRDRCADGGGRATTSPGQDACCLLQGQQPPGGARAHLVHLPRVHLPTTGGAKQERRALHVVHASDEHRGPQSQKRPAPRTADPHAHRPDAQRHGGMAEPHHRRVDELLRPVLPVRDDSPSAARQHLHEALGWEEVSTVADSQAVQAVVDRTARKRARPAGAMEVGPLALNGR